MRDLDSPESGVRYWAIDGLRSHGPEAVDSLLRLLDGPYQSEWGSAAKTLGEIGDARAVHSLTVLYLNRELTLGFVRETAGAALRKIGQADVPLLLTAVTSSDSYLRQEAYELVEPTTMQTGTAN